MQFLDIKEKALEIRELYAQLETAKQTEWTRGDIVHGFIGDVGDLVKLTMAKDGLREIENLDQKLAHELADCLWSIIVIAEKYGVDLEKSFLQTMSELKANLVKRTPQ